MSSLPTWECWLAFCVAMGRPMGEKLIWQFGQTRFCHSGGLLVGERWERSNDVHAGEDNRLFVLSADAESNRFFASEILVAALRIEIIPR